MADPAKSYAGALSFWGTITAAATQGLSATQLQQRVTQEQQRLGVTTTFGTRQEIGRLYSQAVALRQGSRELAQASPEDAITGRMLAPLPYGGTIGLPGAPRNFHVRVPFTSLRAGQEQESYITLEYHGGLPPTVGQLRAEAQAVVESRIGTSTYGEELVAVDDPIIGEL